MAIGVATLGAVVLIMCCGFIGIMNDSADQVAKAEAAMTPEQREHIKQRRNELREIRRAQRSCESSVAAVMKAPSTATFDSHPVAYQFGDYIQISGFVTADNSFGVPLKQPYVYQAKLDGVGSPETVAITIDGKIVAFHQAESDRMLAELLLSKVKREAKAQKGL